MTELIHGNTIVKVPLSLLKRMIFLLSEVDEESDGDTTDIKLIDLIEKQLKASAVFDGDNVSFFKLNFGDKQCGVFYDEYDNNVDDSDVIPCEYCNEDTFNGICPTCRAEQTADQR